MKIDFKTFGKKFSYKDPMILQLEKGLIKVAKEYYQNEVFYEGIKIDHKTKMDYIKQKIEGWLQ